MKLKDKKVGFVLTGSFSTFKNTIPKIKKIVDEGAEVIPIMSEHAYELDTKFGNASDFIHKLQEITGKNVIHTLQEAEPIGIKHLTDIMIIAPATGNTIGKIANGITDNLVTTAVKSHLRNRKSCCNCNINK